MTDPADQAPVGDAELAAVTEAMVALHEHYHGRKPASARTQMMGDDLLACLLGDIYTDVEKTMERRFINEVERVTRRKVARFVSTHHVGPDLELELFVLEPLA